MLDLSKQSASFIDCGGPDKNSMNAALQKRRKHQANHILDLVKQCHSEDLKFALYVVSKTFTILRENGVDSPDLDNLR